MTKLSIVLPCYNEGSTLAELMEGYRQALKGLSDCELILVNNGSTDETAKRLQEEQKKENPFSFKIITTPLNKGYGHGVLQGLAQATGEYLAWSHSDLQCLPEDVVRLYREVTAQPHPQNCFGKGFRVNDRGRAAIFTRVQTFLSGLILGHQLDEINAQPKLFHRDFLKSFRKPPVGYELDVFAYYKAVCQKRDIVTVDVHFFKRKAGKSRWAYSLYSRICFILHNFIYLLKLRLLTNKI